MGEFTPVIGLEIHAELLTKTKIFCGCESKFGGKPNSRVCPVCLGFPGTLPRLNAKAVELAIKAGGLFGCDINKVSKFDRKSYFYPDLPKGYQITQFDTPICTNGRAGIVRIKQIHLEEDAGKLMHAGEGVSEIDFNRAGVPLIEIVTEPDFRNGEEVADFLNDTRTRLRNELISDCKMEQGSFRCDVNISLKESGVRCEIKNLSSIRGTKRAIQAETERQSEILRAGGVIEAVTLRFDEKKRTVTPMRKKEEGADYRYFREPDLPPLVLE